MSEPTDSAHGRFIVFEGGEGSGKSTQAALLAERIEAVLTYEPGGTELGEALRGLLLDATAGEVAPRTEALLMAADRAQHVSELVVPALEAGTHVVSDRYIGSSVAYQGHGRGLDPARVADVSDWATDGLLPDLVVLLVVPAEVAEQRTGAPRDRIEAAGGGFHTRVHEGFLAQAEADPKRWVIVDGSGTVSQVQDRVSAVVGDRLDVIS